MDYFNNVLTTFLGLERVSCNAVYERVRERSYFIKNILVCVLKMNEGLMALDDMRVINDRIFIFE